MTTLVLLRHGQSEWNLENRFTGWVDVDLTEEGERQARQAGRLLKDAGFVAERAYTSVLKRAIRTLWLTLEELDQVYVAEDKDWRLNERHYGALTGLDKAETAAKHGAEQVKVWRRSYDTPPPPLDESDERHPSHDPRYRALDPKSLPATESLKNTLERVLPYWEADLAPRVQAGENLLVVAHGNSLRALVKHLFAMDETSILALEVPTGNPLVIDMDAAALKPKAARYLDAKRAEAIPEPA